MKTKISSTSQLGADVPYFKNKDDKGLVKAIYEVFNKDRLQKLLPEMSILVSFNINSETGYAYTIDYMLKKNSVITLEELDLLSVALKKHVVFIFNKKDLKGASEVGIKFNLSMNRIVLDENSGFLYRLALQVRLKILSCGEG